MRTQLVLDAFRQALHVQHRGDAHWTSEGLIHHSDAGLQGEFNRSMQHQVVEAIVTAPRRTSAGVCSRGSVGAGCAREGRPGVPRRTSVTGRCPGEVLPWAVGVLVCRALPGRVRVGEEHPGSGLESELRVTRKLLPAIPSQRVLLSCSGLVIDAAIAAFIAPVPSRRAMARRSRVASRPALQPRQMDQ